MQRLKSLLRGTAILAIVAPALLAIVPNANAADQVVFRYGIFRQRLSVVELTKFAQTGEQSPVVAKYLREINSDPEEIRKVLNEPIDVNRSILDRGLNNALGNRLLDELGRIVQTPDDEGNREALRDALLASTQTDNKLTALEVIQNYPADEIHLDVKRAIKTYNRVAKYQKPVEEALQKVGPLRQVLQDQGINLPDFLK